MPLAALPTSTLNLLAAGEMMIVPSDLAARRLRRGFDLEQQRAGARVWQPAAVLFWSQWLQSLWTECIVSGCEDRLLLNALQEHHLWREIVRSPTDAQLDDTLASGNAIAELSAAAWRLAAGYRAGSQLRNSATTHDARTFAAWADRFGRVGQRDGYVSHAELETVLAAHISSRALSPPAKLHFSGFLDWVPSQRSLLEALRDAGVTIEFGSHSPASKVRSLLRATNEDEELRTVAVFVRRFLEENACSDIHASVGVLLPEFEGERYALEAAFREVLAPELTLVGADTSSKPYEFISGKPLSSHAMITAGLDLARWAAGPLQMQAVSALLLSPYLCKPEDLEGSAQFDTSELRQAKLLRPEVSLSWLLRLAQRSTFGAAPRVWLQPLQSYIVSANLQAPRAFADWSEFVRRLLRAAGWPGNPASDQELELARAWDHALDNVATLDFTGVRVPFTEALQELERITSSTSFPLATGDAPVQIMRPADLPGMTFDALVFARATDNKWPPKERTNPLIDWRLQASLGMPGTESRRSAARTSAATDVILSSARHVLFSYAANNTEGRQRLSPAFARLELNTMEASELLASATPREHVDPELVADDRPLPPLRSRSIHGGASVLQHQAACPFRAFAEVRLRALSPEEQEAGLDARELGNILHRTLHLFWSDVRTQAALRDMSFDERRKRLTHCIEAAFDHNPRPESEWDHAYISLQKQRLCDLLMTWLDQELKRSPFEVVAAESQQTLSVGPLDLDVRLDRLDRLTDLSKDAVFLVDYKTGYSAKPDDWLGERPDEPQLPMYALLPQAEKLAGLAFAKVRAGKAMEWLGFATDTGILPGKNTLSDLPAMIKDWRTNLTKLAEDFAAGCTDVRPKEYPTTCARCGHRMLCRLDAATLLALSDTDEAGQEESPLV